MDFTVIQLNLGENYRLKSSIRGNTDAKIFLLFSDIIKTGIYKPKNAYSSKKTSKSPLNTKNLSKGSETKSITKYVTSFSFPPQQKQHKIAINYKFIINKLCRFHFGSIVICAQNRLTKIQSFSCSIARIQFANIA